MKIIIPLLTFPLVLFSHIEEPQVIEGKASFHQVNPTHLEIRTDTVTIIDCKQFNIPDNHTVKIVQPDVKSRVLTRVKGSHPSQILGNLESNGKLFLINPNGIFFGPNCTVSTGALIASTLDIANDNFKKGHFQFQLSPEAKASQIVNEGVLTASLEGEIALLAPQIINKGVINAHAERVALLGAPLITLDLTGDHLVSFAIEGELEQGVIKHLGKIACEEGEVFLRLSAAKKVIDSVVNTEGLIEGRALIRDNGVVKIVSQSEIIAKNVSLQGKDVEIAGSLKAPQTLKIEAQDKCLLKQELCAGDIAIKAHTIELDKPINCRSFESQAKKTHLKSDIHAQSHLTFHGETVVENSKILLAADGKKGIHFQDSLSLKTPLKLISSLGPVSFSKVDGVSLASLQVMAPLIEINHPIQLKGPLTLSGKTRLANKIKCSQNTIVFDGPVLIAGHNPILISTGANKGDIRFNGPVNGETPYSGLTMSTGDGDVVFGSSVGKDMPLEGLRVTAKSLELHDIGGVESGVKNLRVLVKNDINIKGSNYNADGQLWEAEQFHIYKPAHFVSQAHAIEFARGIIDLKEGASLSINTKGEAFNFFSLRAAKGAHLSFLTGPLILGEISAPQSVVNMDAKHITIKGNIQAHSITMEAQGDIISGLPSHKIVCKGDVRLNSKEGFIGSQENDTDLSKSRLWVKSDQKIYVGSPKTVNLEGSSIDDKLHPIPKNEPQMIIFNDMETYQFMGEFYEDVEEVFSSLAPHLFTKKRRDYIDTSIVNLPPALIYYKP